MLFFKKPFMLLLSGGCFMKVKVIVLRNFMDWEQKFKTSGLAMVPWGAISQLCAGVWSHTERKALFFEVPKISKYPLGRGGSEGARRRFKKTASQGCESKFGKGQERWRESPCRVCKKQQNRRAIHSRLVSSGFLPHKGAANFYFMNYTFCGWRRATVSILD